MICTFVHNRDGRASVFVPRPHDPPGLYALFFDQGTLHGARRFHAEEDEAKMMPIMFFPAKFSDQALQANLLRHWHQGQAVAVGIEVDTEKQSQLRDTLIDKWQNDLKDIGGKVPPGKPNSLRTGLQRSSGLPFGAMAVAIREHVQLRRVWNVLATGLGREAPFAGGAAEHATYNGPVITSFDAILYSTACDNYQGIEKHRDVYPPPGGEPGQLQALTYIHPPPKDIYRLGLAVSYYPCADRELWRDYTRALITRCSTTPDVDLRHSPHLSLGSAKATKKQRCIIADINVLKKKRGGSIDR